MARVAVGHESTRQARSAAGTFSFRGAVWIAPEDKPRSHASCASSPGPPLPLRLPVSRSTVEAKNF